MEMIFFYKSVTHNDIWYAYQKSKIDPRELLPPG